MAAKSPKRYIASTLVAFILLFILGGVALVRLAPQLQTELATALSPSPERFSELYFTDHLALPKEVTPDTTYTIPITVVSHEGTHKYYQYKVSISKDGQPTEQYSHSFELDHLQTKNFSISFLPTTPNSTYLINVTLQHNNQTIQFRAQS